MDEFVIQYSHISNSTLPWFLHVLVLISLVVQMVTASLVTLAHQRVSMIYKVKKTVTVICLDELLMLMSDMTAVETLLLTLLL
jgi:hypothetical protein